MSGREISLGPMAWGLGLLTSGTKRVGFESEEHEAQKEHQHDISGEQRHGRGVAETTTKGIIWQVSMTEEFE